MDVLSIPTEIRIAFMNKTLTDLEDYNFKEMDNLSIPTENYNDTSSKKIYILIDRYNRYITHTKKITWDSKHQTFRTKYLKKYQCS